MGKDKKITRSSLIEASDFWFHQDFHGYLHNF